MSTRHQNEHKEADSDNDSQGGDDNREMQTERSLESQRQSQAKQSQPLSEYEQEKQEVEALLASCKRKQEEIRAKRDEHNGELDGLRQSLRKLRKDTDDLLKSQNTNLAAMGRKL